MVGGSDCGWGHLYFPDFEKEYIRSSSGYIQSVLVADLRNRYQTVGVSWVCGYLRTIERLGFYDMV